MQSVVFTEQEKIGWEIETPTFTAIVSLEPILLHSASLVIWKRNVFLGYYDWRFGPWA